MIYSWISQLQRPSLSTTPSIQACALISLPGYHLGARVWNAGSRPCPEGSESGEHLLQGLMWFPCTLKAEKPCPTWQLLLSHFPGHAAGGSKRLITSHTGELQAYVLNSAYCLRLFLFLGGLSNSSRHCFSSKCVSSNTNIMVCDLPSSRKIDRSADAIVLRMVLRNIENEKIQLSRFQWLKEYTNFQNLLLLKTPYFYSLMT